MTEPSCKPWEVAIETLGNEKLPLLSPLVRNGCHSQLIERAYDCTQLALEHTIRFHLFHACRPVISKYGLGSVRDVCLADMKRNQSRKVSGEAL